MNKKRLTYIKSEQGYLLISTIFFLVFSGLFSHSLIRISGNQIMQLRQFKTAYEAKAAMNMGEVLLEDYMEEENISPKKGKIKTSVGDINIKKKSEINYQLTITLENGEIFSKEIKVKSKKIDKPPEETEEKEDENVEVNKEKEVNRE